MLFHYLHDRSGLDASIQFESDRPENIGMFLNETIGQFSQFTSPLVSISDLIGVVCTALPLQKRILRINRV
jgi:hypothetical protein